MSDDYSMERLRLMRRVFTAMDVDGDGHITAVELTQMASRLSTLGHPNLGPAIQFIISQYDHDGDGQIDFPEFLTMCNSANTPFIIVPGSDGRAALSVSPQFASGQQLAQVWHTHTHTHTPTPTHTHTHPHTPGAHQVGLAWWGMSPGMPV
eukprot:NODE_565_length_1549_cov_27.964000_g412_i0.p3 GENE.NODE_565_length_1549_cov_27.964000_g412_i0~~NODE_565_length_1549_cov_27.964000_g412_i0.p3  ORF type:complete len:170 (-),score=75.31 NODE_565_length_1549_cov_27.964000_g412_i0:1040-1492(-)